MKKCIDKAAIENILHKLWKKDTGYEYIDIVQIAYNRALQDVQCEMDTIEVQEEPVSEDKMTISKEWFEHCKKSWYNEGYIDGEYNRDRQFEELSEELEDFAKRQADEFAEREYEVGSYDRDYLSKGYYWGCKAGANWQKERIEEVLLSEVLPCFMHGGEADEVVAKLDEVLNEKK